MNYDPRDYEDMAGAGFDSVSRAREFRDEMRWRIPICAFCGLILWAVLRFICGRTLSWVRRRFQWRQMRAPLDRVPQVAQELDPNSLS